MTGINNSLDALATIGTNAKLKLRNGKVTKVAHQAELEEQAALIEWADKTVIDGIKIGNYLLHIPNEGKRGSKAARDAKRLGMKKGVHDLFLALPRGSYSGLWIEMKAVNGKASTAQLEWQSLMRGAGYRAEICYGFCGAKIEIERYLK
ncbi:VRR-NUC domain-containing protein [Pectobacterium actinidiae]|uniref:VRR-NUC domain-containing protein n=1 Tax=Pectobacterium actinidiae TaxID=1507808 RepID=UPI0023AB22D5|nr:VRR-NUC domain-containing protein [Pectobacterium actinidiae]WEF10317.1 VRR-NUC domain-containing protein [Pectobacterium actinidiae]